MKLSGARLRQIIREELARDIPVEEVQSPRSAPRRTQGNDDKKTQDDKKDELDEVQLSHAGIGLKRGNTLPPDPSLERDPAKVKRRSLLSLGSSLATAARVIGDLKRLGLDLPPGIEEVFENVEEADRLFDALKIRF